jgi:O-antigen/teichoic acid export membrane protein
MVLLAAGIQLIMLFSEICVLPVHHSLSVVIYGEKWVEFRLFMSTFCLISVIRTLCRVADICLSAHAICG